MKLKPRQLIRYLIRSVFYFLPVQLLILHFRKYQILLGFWIIIMFIIRGNLAAHFGAASLFLTPEYMGNTGFISMFVMGGAMCVFIMTWHITTFIIHSKRIPYMGATRHAFVIYCINNSIIPLAFLLFYSVYTVHFQYKDEHFNFKTVLLLQTGFYLGILIIILLSFAYFFRVSRDFFKTILSKITNPARIRGIIPYDSLDYDLDIIPSKSFISGRLKILKTTELPPYQPRVMNTILRRHHRNVIFAALISYILLLIMGIFMEEPLLRVPAGAGFLLLFSIIMGVVGAFKYFLKSWEAIGWIIFIALLAKLVEYQAFDLRSIAYGLDYHTSAAEVPAYNYNNIHDMFNSKRYLADRELEETRLQSWKNNVADDTEKPPIVVITVSGGGSRSAYWTFRALQYADSITHGRLFSNTVFMTGASGGMIGAAYWRSLHDAYSQGLLKEPYAARYQENIGKDLLNSIIFSLASVDLISPFNRVKSGGYSYTRDRGYAMEQEMGRNTEGLLDKNLGFFKEREAKGIIPEMAILGTIVNDGRRLIISNQPSCFLTQPEYSLNQAIPPIDCIDFSAFFAAQHPYNIRLTSALRMNATFPFVLPVVKLPSNPGIDIMDAGLSDNFGNQIATRYLSAMRSWLGKNAGDIIFLEIRDTRESGVVSYSSESSLGSQLFDPLFVIQDKWEAFQSYTLSYIKETAPYAFNGRLKYLTLQYFPAEPKRAAELNFHLSRKEKEDIYSSIAYKGNLDVMDTLVKLLTPPKTKP